MAQIAVFEAEKWEQGRLKSAFPKHSFQFFDAPFSTSNVNQVKEAEVIIVFIYSNVTADLLKKMANLKFIATMSTGFDHIDMQACKERSIAVSNVPYYGENTVAEHTFALILALSRNLIKSVERARRGNFAQEGLRGFDLKGKTLGVIGTGHIGQQVLRIASGLSMNAIAFDLKKDQRSAKKIGFKYVQFDTLLKQSDIVSVHVPYSKNTHHLINKTVLGKMKKGAYLINTARGGIIDTNALIEALSSGRLGGAGLDVLEEESAIKEEKQLLSRNLSANIRTMLENHVLMTYDNVVITPHCAFNSKEAIDRILDTTIENVNSYFKKRPVNVV